MRACILIIVRVWFVIINPFASVNGHYTSASCMDIDVRNRFGNILKGLQLKMTTGEAY